MPKDSQSLKKSVDPSSGDIPPPETTPVRKRAVREGDAFRDLDKELVLRLIRDHLSSQSRQKE